MKTTIDLPDELMVEVKMEAALQHKKLRELVPDLIRAGLKNQSHTIKPSSQRSKSNAWISEIKKLGQEITKKSIDKRTCVEILNTERR